jgi:hypothetical protein
MPDFDNLMASTRSLLTGEPRPQTVAEQVEEECCKACPRLSWKQRLIGFSCCFALGVVVELGSFMRIVELVGGNPKPFAVTYSLGNVIAICSSFFLAGPYKQCKSMLAPTRVIATATYLVAIGATLFVALFDAHIPARAGLIILLVCVQTIALFWYMISYIPFARDFVKNCCKGCCADATGMGA